MWFVLFFCGVAFGIHLRFCGTSLPVAAFVDGFNVSAVTGRSAFPARKVVDGSILLGGDGTGDGVSYLVFFTIFVWPGVVRIPAGIPI